MRRRQAGIPSWQQPLRTPILSVLSEERCLLLVWLSCQETEHSLGRRVIGWVQRAHV